MTLFCLWQGWLGYKSQVLSCLLWAEVLISAQFPVCAVLFGCMSSTPALLRSERGHTPSPNVGHGWCSSSALKASAKISWISSVRVPLRVSWNFWCTYTELGDLLSQPSSLHNSPTLSSSQEPLFRVPIPLTRKKKSVFLRIYLLLAISTYLGVTSGQSSEKKIIKQCGFPHTYGLHSSCYLTTEMGFSLGV